MVSATQILGNMFGSRTMPQGTGIWLNESIAYSTWESSFVEPAVLAVEGDIPESIRNELSAMSHNVNVDQRGLDNAYGLTVEYDSEGKPVQFTGGADPRGVGVASGY